MTTDSERLLDPELSLMETKLVEAAAKAICEAHLASKGGSFFCCPLQAKIKLGVLCRYIQASMAFFFKKKKTCMLLIPLYDKECHLATRNGRDVRDYFIKVLQ